MFDTNETNETKETKGKCILCEINRYASLDNKTKNEWFNKKYNELLYMLMDYTDKKCMCCNNKATKSVHIDKDIFPLEIHNRMFLCDSCTVTDGHRQDFINKVGGREYIGYTYRLLYKCERHIKNNITMLR